MNKIKTRLVVGLGNPGKKYENTRHNAGFLAADELAKSLKAPDFEFNKRLNSEISIASIKLKNASSELIIAKPQTFMNKSGEAVAPLAKLYKIKPENILIAHDDVDILWGKFKFSFGRSSAGHKGVESIIKSLKTKNFWRLRIGIQPLITEKIKADKLILKKFSKAELELLKKTVRRASSEKN